MKVSYYFNDKGERVVIAEMQDNHLLNAYIKYKKEKELLEKTSPEKMGFVINHIAELEEIIVAMRNAILKKGLF